MRFTIKSLFVLNIAVLVIMSMLYAQAEVEKKVEAPWPYVTFPASEWRCLTLTSTAADTVTATDLLKPDEIGLPHTNAQGIALSWDRPHSSRDGGINCSTGPGTLYAVTNLFNPLIYRSQQFTFRLAAAQQSELYINGKRMTGTRAADGTFICRYAGHQMRTGVNRIVVAIPTVETAMLNLKLEMTSPGDIKYFADLPPALDPHSNVNVWKSASITNGLINALVAIPDTRKGYYRGNRFEQAGILLHLNYHGHTYFLEQNGSNTPLDSHRIVGPAEEFFDAIAWDDAKTGEPFIKVGVGLYEKPSQEEHTWYQPYWLLKFFPWKTQVQGNTITFTQVVKGPRSWGYRYVKRLVLVPGMPTLRIEHTFTNTGKHLIRAEQYNHNFVNLDKSPVGQGYRIHFSYIPTPLKDVSKSVRVVGQDIELLAPNTPTTPVSGLTNGVSNHVFTISRDGSPAAIRITDDMPPASVALFTTQEAVCVEPFIRFELKPGETARWTREYTFSETGPDAFIK